MNKQELQELIEEMDVNDKVALWNYYQDCYGDEEQKIHDLRKQEEFNRFLGMKFNTPMELLQAAKRGYFNPSESHAWYEDCFGGKRLESSDYPEQWVDCEVLAQWCFDDGIDPYERVKNL